MSQAVKELRQSINRKDQAMINIGFLGCSNFVRLQHLQNAFFSKVCRVHTLCDINSEVLSRTHQQFPGLKTTTDADVMLKDPAIDLVVIAMLPSLHAEMTLKAIQAGKHVLVEKPMAESEEDCRQIVKIARERNVHVCIGFNRRFAPAIEYIHTLLMDRKSPAIIEYSITNDSFWRMGTHWEGRNGLLDEIVHIFDLTTYLVGSCPVRIYATDSGFNNNVVVVEYEDKSSVMINANENGTSVAPKEMMRITFDGHFVHMKEFVEVEDITMERTAIRYFPGRKYIQTAPRYNEMIETFATGGFEAYKKVREELAHILHASRNGTLSEEVQNDLVKNPLPPINYMVDKGWAASLDGYAKSLQEHTTPKNADGRAGTMATYMANMTIASARCHQALSLDRTVWEQI